MSSCHGAVRRFRLPGAHKTGWWMMGCGRTGTRHVMVTLPTDEGAVLDLYLAAGCGAADPYWATLWPSAVALATALLAEPQLVAGLRVCDVGAGLGLGGLGAALAGAAEVRFCRRCQPLYLPTSAAYGVRTSRLVAQLGFLPRGERQFEA